jgi:hypothetical protein
MQMAKNGDIRALTLCLDRIFPARKERSITLELRPIESLQDLPIHFQDITTAIAEGRITPSEGESMSNILTNHSQIMASVEVDRRLAKLEGSLDEAKVYRKELSKFIEETGKLGSGQEVR